MPRTMNLAAVKAAILSDKTPEGLKKGLIKKYHHLLEGVKMPMGALASTMRPNPQRQAHKEYMGIPYEIWYSHNKGYFIRSIYKNIFSSWGFPKYEQAEEHAEHEINGYLERDNPKKKLRKNPERWKIGDILLMSGGSGIQNKFEIIQRRGAGFIVKNLHTGKEFFLEPEFFHYFSKSTRGAFSNPMDPETKQAYKRFRRTRRKHKRLPKDRDGITPNGIKINADLSYRQGLISAPERDQAIKRYKQKMTGELTRGGFLVGDADVYVTEGPKGTYTVDYPAKKYTGRIKGVSKMRAFLKPAKAMGLKISWA